MDPLNLMSLERVTVKQQFELAEMFGFETRNKYAIYAENFKPL